MFSKSLRLGSFLLVAFIACALRANASFEANGDVIISDVSLENGAATAVVFSGSVSDSFMINNGSVIISNPGVFKIGSNDVGVGSIAIVKDRKIVACANNTTPGTSYVKVPSTAGSYSLQLGASKCKALGAAAEVKEITVVKKEAEIPASVKAPETIAVNLEVRSIKNIPAYGNLKGSILIKTEDAGKAYYVHPENKKAYYLGRAEDAYAVMREQGVGISNTDLKKIPVGISQVVGADQDGDGLSDILEDSIGTDKLKADSDGDGYQDKVEVMNGYNALGAGKAKTDAGFSKKQQGKIVLQVENHGEAWYIDARDNKRYFLGRAEDAFAVMKKAGLGISNQDFNKLD